MIDRRVHPHFLVTYNAHLKERCTMHQPIMLCFEFVLGQRLEIGESDFKA
jgi:hypothetical protein